MVIQCVKILLFVCAVTLFCSCDRNTRAEDNDHPQKSDHNAENIVPEPAPFNKIAQSEVPAAAVLDPAPQTFSSFDALIRAGLSEELGREADFEIKIQRENSDHIYSCGIPLETDNQDFNYADSKLNKEYEAGSIDNLFCLLAAKEGAGFMPLEIEVGMTDSPALNWKETHNVSDEVIP